MPGEKIKINHQYQYEDYDIGEILDLRLQQENLENVFTLPPSGDSEQGHLPQELKDEITRNGGLPNRTLLIPYHLGSHFKGHWVGIVVVFKNNKVQNITFYDSLGGVVPQTLQNEMIRAYRVKLNLESDEGLIQPDLTSCGAFTIENLINAAKGQVIAGLGYVEGIRSKHVTLMEEFAPGLHFSIRQHYNVPSFQPFKQSATVPANPAVSAQAVKNKPSLQSIAEDYKTSNIAPFLNKEELLEYVVQAINAAQLAFTLQNPVSRFVNHEVLTYLTALSAIVRSLELNYEQFTKENSGIPWNALSNLVRDINLPYETSHGIAGHVVLPNKRGYLSPEFHKKLVVEILKELDLIRSTVELFRNFTFFKLKLPIGNNIKAISEYLSEDYALDILSKGVEVCSFIKDLSASENRIFYLRQIALIGEVLAQQLPDHLMNNIDQAFVNFCKLIRNAIDHFETEFVYSQSGDKDLKEIVYWLKQFIEKGVFDNPPKILVNTGLTHLVTQPELISSFFDEVFPQTSPVQPKLNFHHTINWDSFETDDIGGNFIPYNIATHLTDDEELMHNYQLGVLSESSDNEQEEKVEEFDEIAIRSQRYIQNFANDVSEKSDIFTQIQFLLEFEKGSISVSTPEEIQELQDKYEEIKGNFFQVHKKTLYNGEILSTPAGTLNKIANKGGGEDLDKINGLLFYLYLFKEKFKEHKLIDNRNALEKQFIKEYVSAERSYVAKMKQVAAATHLSAKDKLNYLNDFLKLFKTKYDKFHGKGEDSLSDTDREFSLLYDQLSKEYSGIVAEEQKARKDSADKVSRETEQAVQLISSIVAASSKAIEYKQKLHEFSTGISARDEISLEVLNKYQIGIDLLREIGGERFILAPNVTGVVIVKDKDVKEFTKFLQQQPIEVHKRIEDLRGANLTVDAVRKQQDAISYGLQIKNPLTLPEGYEIDTFYPLQEVGYNRYKTAEEKAEDSFTSKLLHSNREFYQILIGSYARALLDNETFRKYASQDLLDKLETFRAARGYLGHNTEPNLGKGQDIEVHSSSIAFSVLQDLERIIPELLLLKLFITDNIDDFRSTISSLGATTSAGQSISKTLHGFNTDWLSGDQIAMVGHEINDDSLIAFIPTVDAHLSPDQYGSVKKAIEGSADKKIVAMAINLSHNISSTKGKGNHWVLYIAIQDGANIQGIILDPLGSNSYRTSLEAVADNIAQIYLDMGINADIDISSLGMQRDGFNCGVWNLYFLEILNKMLAESNNSELSPDFLNEFKVYLVQHANQIDIQSKRAEYLRIFDGVSDDGKQKATSGCKDDKLSTGKDNKKDDEDDNAGSKDSKKDKGHVVDVSGGGLSKSSNNSDSSTSDNIDVSGSSKQNTLRSETDLVLLDEKTTSQMNYYLEHGIMFDTLREYFGGENPVIHPYNFNNMQDTVFPDTLIYAYQMNVVALSVCLFTGLTNNPASKVVIQTEGLGQLACLLKVAYDYYAGEIVV